jgi:hypothetical protein
VNDDLSDRFLDAIARLEEVADAVTPTMPTASSMR